MKEKLSLFKELIKLAQSDNEMREEKYKFLLTITQSLHVNQKDFDALIDIAQKAGRQVQL